MFADRRSCRGGAQRCQSPLYQRWQYTQDQRMTKDEVKREFREQDGDPHLKQERMRVHREAMEHSMLEQVRRADVPS
ncbi:MAG: EscU/YscU/HrcU family type III secretion system export apparatus switch protein [Polyangiales bacterium]